MSKNRKMLPFVLLLAAVLTLGQTIFAAPGLSVQDGASSSNVALAAEPNPPIFLPVVVMRDAPDSVFGIDLGAITEGNGLNQMVQAGSNWVRRGSFFWPSVEPNRGERNWGSVSNFDAELEAASAKGLKTILVIQNAPSWALVDPTFACGPIKAEEFATLASFVHDVVARYSQPPYNVKYFEIFNEPDSHAMTPDQNWGCWGNTNDPTYFGGEYYGQMLKVVYPQLKAANSDAKLVLGGVLMGCDPKKSDCASTKFLEGVLHAGAGNSFDILSFHTYDYYYEGSVGEYGNPSWDAQWDTTGPALNVKLAYLKGLLTKYQIPNKPLFATELALLCGNNCNADFETTKASFLVQSYVYALKEGVQSGIWYDVFGLWKNNGLLAQDLNQLPAYNAYKTAQDKLGGAVYVREVTGQRDVRIFEFNNGDRLLWVAWATKTGTHKVTFPRQPLGVWDVQGNSLGAPTSYNATNIPIFVEVSK